MVNWRVALVLLGILVGLGALIYVTNRPTAAPQPVQVGNFLCATENATLVRIQSPKKVVELQRRTLVDAWRLTQPVQSAADSDSVQTLMGSISAIRVVNTLQPSGLSGADGLDKPRQILTCRVVKGASYNLSVGTRASTAPATTPRSRAVAESS